MVRFLRLVQHRVRNVCIHFEKSIINTMAHFVKFKSFQYSELKYKTGPSSFHQAWLTSSYYVHDCNNSSLIRWLLLDYWYLTLPKSPEPLCGFDSDLGSHINLQNNCKSRDLLLSFRIFHHTEENLDDTCDSNMASIYLYICGFMSRFK